MESALFKFHNKVNKNNLINTPLTASIRNKRDNKVLCTRVQFYSNEIVMQPSNKTSVTDSINNTNNTISINLEKKLN